MEMTPPPPGPTGGPSTIPASLSSDRTLDAAMAPTMGGSTQGWSLVRPPGAPEGARYTFEAVFAEGGLGRIRRAYDHRLLRHVAVKELHKFQPGSAGEVRFHREALLTARLEHPSIVPIHDVGAHPSGEPFYCMKLVDGQSLDALVRSRPALVDRLALVSHVLAAADALAYAHDKGVIHRDLKPANVLIGAFGETMVIDWGLAKDLRADDVCISEHSGDAPVAMPAGELTQTGELMGTLAFMPPEQAAGERIDARADVYALGSILYYVLAGDLPYERMPAVALLTTLLTEAPVDLVNRVKGLPEDLLAIVRKAMARAPDDRYVSAQELAADLRRFQTGRLVSARPYSPLDVLRHYLRRYRVAVAVAVVGLVLLTIIGVYSYRRVVEQKQEADGLRDDAITAREEEAVARRSAEQQSRLAIRSSVELLLQSARRALYEEHQPQRALVALSRAYTAAPERDDIRYLLGDALAAVQRHQYTILEVDDLRFSPDGARFLTWGPAGTLDVWDAPSGTPLGQLDMSPADDFEAAFIPGSSEQIIVRRPTEVRRYDGLALQWRSETLEGYAAWSFTGTEPEHVLLFGHDANAVLDLRTGALRRTGPGTPGDPLPAQAAKVNLVVALPDGQRMIERFPTDVIRVGPRGQSIDHTGTFFRNLSHSIVASADGRYFSYVEEVGKNGVILADHTAGQTDKLDPCGTVDDQRDDNGLIPTAAFTPDGSSLVRLVGLSEVARWSTTSRACLGTRAIGGGEYSSLLPMPDGSAVLLVGTTGTLQILDIENLQTRGILYAGDRALRRIQISPDSRRIAVVDTANEMHMLQLFDERQVLSEPILDIEQGSRPGEVILLTEQGGQHALHALRVSQGGELERTDFTGPTTAKRLLSPRRTGDLLFAVDEARLVWEFWSLHDRRRLATLESGDAGLDFSQLRGSLVGLLLLAEENALDTLTRSGLTIRSPPRPPHDRSVDLLRLVTVPVPRGVRFAEFRAELFDLDNGARLQGIDAGYANFSPDGRLLFTSNFMGSVQLHDATTGAWLRELHAPGAMHRTSTGDDVAHFSSDAQRFVISLGDGTITLWDAETLQRTGSLYGHRQYVDTLIFGPTSDVLVSVGERANSDGQVFLWDLDQLRGRRLEVSDVTAIAFSPDDRILALGSRDGVVRLWDARTAERMGEFRGHDGAIRLLTFGEDGTRLISGSSGERVIVWVVEQEARTPDALRRALGETLPAAVMSTLDDD